MIATVYPIVDQVRFELSTEADIQDNENNFIIG